MGELVEEVVVEEATETQMVIHIITPVDPQDQVVSQVEVAFLDLMGHLETVELMETQLIMEESFGLLALQKVPCFMKQAHDMMQKLPASMLLQQSMMAYLSLMSESPYLT